ncbi:MAG: response regulator [Methylobacterium mesophilicum]|nr:response regulator [Methylobacterium mesophilicum]
MQSEKRCLLVEGSDVVRKVARRILQSEGIEVDEARDASDALMRASFRMPDLLIVDGSLPNGEALDLFRRFALAERKPALLVSLIEMDLGAIMRARRVGANGFLLKPFNRMQLVTKVLPLLGSEAAAA